MMTMIPESPAKGFTNVFPWMMRPLYVLSKDTSSMGRTVQGKTFGAVVQRDVVYLD